jgi:hypothetical protein
VLGHQLLVLGQGVGHVALYTVSLETVGGPRSGAPATPCDSQRRMCARGSLVATLVPCAVIVL